jgi:hypothetical protein
MWGLGQGEDGKVEVVELWDDVGRALLSCRGTVVSDVWSVGTLTVPPCFWCKERERPPERGNMTCAGML